MSAEIIVFPPPLADPSQLEIDRFVDVVMELWLEFKKNSDARRADICLQLEALLKLVKP